MVNSLSGSAGSGVNCVINGLQELSLTDNGFGKRPKQHFDALLHFFKTDSEFEHLQQEQRISFELFLTLSPGELDSMRRYIRVSQEHQMPNEQEYSGVIAYLRARTQTLQTYNQNRLASLLHHFEGTAPATVASCLESYMVVADPSAMQQFLSELSLLVSLLALSAEDAQELEQIKAILKNFVLEQQVLDFVFCIEMLKDAECDIVDEVVAEYPFELLRDYALDVLAADRKKTKEVRARLELVFHMLLHSSLHDDVAADAKDLLVALYGSYELPEMCQRIHALEGDDDLECSEELCIELKDRVFKNVSLWTIYDRVTKLGFHHQAYHDLLQVCDLILHRIGQTFAYTSEVIAKEYINFELAALRTLNSYIATAIQSIEQPQLKAVRQKLKPLQEKAYWACDAFDMFTQAQQMQIPYGSRPIAEAVRLRISLSRSVLNRAAETHFIPMVYDFLFLLPHEVGQVVRALDGTIQDAAEKQKIETFLQQCCEQVEERLSTKSESLYGTLFDKIDSAASLVMEFTADRKQLMRDCVFKGIVCLMEATSQLPAPEPLQDHLVRIIEAESPEFRIRKMAEVISYRRFVNRFGGVMDEMRRRLIEGTPLPFLFKQMCRFIKPHAQHSIVQFLEFALVLQEKIADPSENRLTIEQLQSWMLRLFKSFDFEQFLRYMHLYEVQFLQLDVHEWITSQQIEKMVQKIEEAAEKQQVILKPLSQFICNKMRKNPEANHEEREELQGYLWRLYICGRALIPHAAGLWEHVKEASILLKGAFSRHEKRTAELLDLPHARIEELARAANKARDPVFTEALLLRSLALENMGRSAAEELQALACVVVQYAAASSLDERLQMHTRASFWSTLCQNMSRPARGVSLLKIAYRLTSEVTFQELCNGMQEMQRSCKSFPADCSGALMTMLVSKIQEVVYRSPVDMRTKLQLLIDRSFVPLAKKFPQIIDRDALAFVNELLAGVVGNDEKAHQYRSELQALLWTMQAWQSSEK